MRSATGVAGIDRGAAHSLASLKAASRLWTNRRTADTSGEQHDRYAQVGAHSSAAWMHRQEVKRAWRATRGGEPPNFTWPVLPPVHRLEEHAVHLFWPAPVVYVCSTATPHTMVGNMNTGGVPKTRAVPAHQTQGGASSIQQQAQAAASGGAHFWGMASTRLWQWWRSCIHKFPASTGRSPPGLGPHTSSLHSHHNRHAPRVMRSVQQGERRAGGTRATAAAGAHTSLQGLPPELARGASPGGQG